MKSRLADPVHYELIVDDDHVNLNTLLGKTFNFVFSGEIYCIQCGRKTTKSFQQGYCFPCYRELLNNQLCVIHPERCLFQGECPKDHWVTEGHGEPHIVYLANSSGLKVGVTRETQIPTRWIDQGAIQALPIIKVANRYQAGLLEAELKNYVNDKTNWRAMLKNEVKKINLMNERDKLFKLIKNNASISWLKNEKPIDIQYPVLNYPTKVVSFDFDKQSLIAGKLLGIKGQYLIFDTGVINIRKFGGYKIKIEVVMD